MSKPVEFSRNQTHTAHQHTSSTTTVPTTSKRQEEVASEETALTEQDHEHELLEAGTRKVELSATQYYVVQIVGVLLGHPTLYVYATCPVVSAQDTASSSSSSPGSTDYRLGDGTIADEANIAFRKMYAKPGRRSVAIANLVSKAVSARSHSKFESSDKSSKLPISATTSKPIFQILYRALTPAKESYLSRLMSDHAISAEQHKHGHEVRKIRLPKEGSKEDSER